MSWVYCYEGSWYRGPSDAGPWRGVDSDELPPGLWNGPPGLRIGSVAQGVIRKQGSEAVLGTWRADARSLSVQTEDPGLRAAADRILSTPQQIPLKPPRHWQEAGPESAARTAPVAYKYIPILVMELEALGYEVEQTDEEA